MRICCSCKRFTVWHGIALIVSTYGLSVALAVAIAAAEHKVTPLEVRAGLWEALFHTMIIAAAVCGVLGGRATRRLWG